MKFLKKNGEPMTKKEQRESPLRKAERLAKGREKKRDGDEPNDNAEDIDQRDRHMVGEQRDDAADERTPGETEVIGREILAVFEQRDVEENLIDEGEDGDRSVDRQHPSPRSVGVAAKKFKRHGRFARS
jgi:hypothetical protein